MFEKILGASALIGGIIAMGGMLPQIIHLLRVKDSTGLSIIAWFIWVAGDSLLLAYAITIRDPIFIMIHVFYVGAGVATIILAMKYRRPKEKS